MGRVIRNQRKGRGSIFSECDLFFRTGLEMFLPGRRNSEITKSRKEQAY
jgi:hypothetical protein